MKGSSAGARHLAESANWLAWQQRSEYLSIGTLMETAVAHWSRAQFDDFARWYRSLPQDPWGRRRSA